MTTGVGVTEAGGKSRPLQLYQTLPHPASAKGDRSARRSSRQASSRQATSYERRGSAAKEWGAGYAVYDPVGQKIGSAEEVFVNLDGEPVYIRVRIGLLMTRTVLIPVQFVETDDERKPSS